MPNTSYLHLGNYDPNAKYYYSNLGILKLATIWFDTVIIDYDDISDIGGQEIMNLLDNIKTSNFNKDILSNLFISGASRYPRDDRRYTVDYDPVGGKHYKFWHALSTVAEDEYPSAKYGDFYDWLNGPAMTEFHYGDLVRWFVLNQHVNCCAITDNIGGRVIEKLLNHSFRNIDNSNSSDFSLFSTLCSQKLPNVDNMDWSHILDIRNHPFIESFRKKNFEYSCLCGQYDKKQMTEFFDEIKLKALEDIAKLFKPNLTNNFINFIASNLPVPAPINPISISIGAKEFLKQYTTVKKFGWVYFYLDLQGVK